MTEGKKAADQGEAVYRTTRNAVAGIAIISFLLCLALAFGLIKNVSGPVRRMTELMGKLAQGDLTTTVDIGVRKDEIGAMALAVSVFKDGMVQAERLRDAEASEARAKAGRSQKLEQLMVGFEGAVTVMVGQFSASSTELEATAQSMSGTAAQTNTQADSAGGAAAAASSAVQAAAAAAEELSASIGEITRQVGQAAQVSQQAVESTRATDTLVRALADGAGRIGQVVDLISNIAGQTNLLALNATIEAARAGDAGRGFAVVASEVKALATKTAEATDEIGQQIRQIQQSTDQAVQAIRQIMQTSEQISTITTSIAAAMEEQSAATAEIARNVQQTAQATGGVTTSIEGVSQAATDTGTASQQVLGAAGDLSRQAAELATEVRSFLGGVRAA
jgi:methyl-accepting chemotaxis protein